MQADGDAARWRRTPGGAHAHDRDVPILPLYLREVAGIQVAFQDAQAFSFRNDVPGCKVTLQRNSDSNTVTLIEGVKAAIAEGDRVAVEGALSEADPVVVRGAETLHDGDTVDVIGQRKA